MKIGIIGSGISGMMTAWMLAGRGCDITLFDRQQPGQESSWAGGGIVSPLYPWRYADSVTRLAHGGCHAYDLAHHAACVHDANGSQGFVGDADASARHE